MISPMVTQSVVIVTPGDEASPYGGTRDDWDAVTRVTAQGWIQQASVSEAPAGSRTDDGSTWTLVLRGAPAISERCRVEYAGDVYRVAGEPKRVGLRGRAHHVEVTLVRLGEI